MLRAPRRAAARRARDAHLPPGGHPGPVAPSTDQRDDDTRLRRGVTGPLLLLFVLGDVLGAGVYALVGTIAAEVGGAVWLPLVVALGMAMLTATSYAELVTKYPRAGGAAVFAQRAFGRPWVSFLVGWSMLAAGVTSAAGLAVAFGGDYLSPFLDAPASLVALAFLAVVAAVNARGVKESLGANVVMTLVEVSGLVLVVVLGAIVLGRGDGDLGRALELPPDVSPWAAVLGAALIAFYSFVGFETSANLAEEVRDVRRTYPRALFASLVVAGVVYVLVALASVVVLPPEDLQRTSGPLLAVVDAAGGVPSWLFGLVALVAVANGALLTMVMASRLTYGMAEEGLLPAVLGRTLPGRRTPWVAIVVTTALAMGLTLVGSLETLASTVVLLLLVVFASTNTAVLVLRRDEVPHEHFRAPTALPVLALVSVVVLLTQQPARNWLIGGALLVLGAVVHLLTRPRNRATA